MSALETRLFRAALNYGKWMKTAGASKTMKDRIQLVRSETRLCVAAEAVFKKEEERDARRRNKS